MFSPSKLVDYTRKRAPLNRIINTRSPQWREIQGSQWKLTFDGVDDDVRTANALPIGSGDFSVSWRFRSNYSSVGANDVMVCNRDIVGSTFPITIYFFQNSSNQKLRCRTFNSAGTPFSVDSLTAINDNIEHHAFFYREGSTIYLYLDGVFQDSTGGIVGDFSNSHILQIGRAVFFGTQAAFNGFISDVRIWDRAPDGLGEITRISENPQAQPDMLGLVGEWRFQEGFGVADGTQIRDWSNFQNHGSMQGFSGNPWIYTGIL